MADKGSTFVSLDILLDLSQGVLGLVQSVYLKIERLVIGWTVLLHPARVLRIQPVFIGAGLNEEKATGTAFNPLMARVRELWSRCGTVRCITLRGARLHGPGNRKRSELLDGRGKMSSMRSKSSWWAHGLRMRPGRRRVFLRGNRVSEGCVV